MLKGIFSGLGALVIALIKRESVPGIWYIGSALILGFVAYGLSIFLYVRAQNALGAAKTSAYYAAAPFVGAFLSFAVLRERLSWMYFIALIVMLGGSGLVVADTLIRHHVHEHQHTFTHTHDGTGYAATIVPVDAPEELRRLRASKTAKTALLNHQSIACCSPA